jgi:DNA-binding transcriptional LysR family regulator
LPPYQPALDAQRVAVDPPSCHCPGDHPSEGDGPDDEEIDHRVAAATRQRGRRDENDDDAEERGAGPDDGRKRMEALPGAREGRRCSPFAPGRCTFPRTVDRRRR